MRGTRAVVIEEVPLVRAGIVSVLRDQHVVVVAEADSTVDSLSLVKASGAHLVVVGGGWLGEGLADAIRRLKERGAVRVLALVPRSTRDELMAVLDAGADAVVPHDASREELITAAEAAAAGAHHLSPVLAAALFGSSVAPTPAETVPHLLTSRERSVVRLLAEGCTNDEIGERLYISSATVKTHLSNTYDKLGARNRYDAVVKAAQIGVL